MTKTFRLQIQYDGTRYKGWQKQTTTELTIQGKLESILSRLYDKPIEVHGSGRTDAGVHATGQIASIKVTDQYDAAMLMQHINQYLPEDIAVLSVTEMNKPFHARFDAVEKTYVYRIWTAPYSPVFDKRIVYHYKGKPLNIDLMKAASTFLIGSHDFKAFTTEKTKKSTVRILKGIEIVKTQEEIIISYKGDGFLHNMVRILTGTLISVGAGNITPDEVNGILSGLTRANAGDTAPGCGLTLKEVRY